jgi:hypothetical protein
MTTSRPTRDDLAAALAARLADAAICDDCPTRVGGVLIDHVTATGIYGAANASLKTRTRTARVYTLDGLPLTDEPPLDIGDGFTREWAEISGRKDPRMATVRQIHDVAEGLAAAVAERDAHALAAARILGLVGGDEAPAADE